MLIKLWPRYWKTHLKRMNQKVDKENGKSLGIGNGQYQKVSRFSRNEIWKNIGCLVSAHTFGLGVPRLWKNEEDIKISRKKSKGRSIQINVDLYEVCIYYTFYCLHFYFMTMIIPPFLRQICGISVTRGKEFINY